MAQYSIICAVLYCTFKFPSMGPYPLYIDSYAQHIKITWQFYIKLTTVLRDEH